MLLYKRSTNLFLAPKNGQIITKVNNLLTNNNLRPHLYLRVKNLTQTSYFQTLEKQKPNHHILPLLIELADY